MTVTRKLFNTIGFILPGAALIGAGYTGCDKVTTVVLITLATAINGFVYAGFQVNHMDIASNYSGLLLSLTNCSAQVCGFLAPYIVGLVVTSQVNSRSP